MRNRSQILTAVACAITLFLAIAYGVMQVNTPQPAAADAPAQSFSAGRAGPVLQALVGNGVAHDAGSADAKRFRTELVSRIEAMGLEAKLEPSNLTTPWMITNKTVDATETEIVSPVSTTNLTNVSVRVPGTDPNAKAVLVASHLDSVLNGPGAADDGSQVASMVETIRALKAAPPLKHDVIFLFTDGEELGLRGARDFVVASPDAKDVGYILNFEYRGTTGKALFFEGNNVNSEVIDVYRQAEPAPLASSIFYFIYQQLDNNTDFSVFRSLGVPGLALAPAGNNVRYHTPSDDMVNFSPGSMQYSGDLMLGLVRQVGDQDTWSNGEEEQLTWFNVGPVLLSYSNLIAILVTLLGLLLWFGAMFLAMRGRSGADPVAPANDAETAVTRRGIARGLGTTALASGIALVFGELMLFVIYMVRWDTRHFMGFHIIHDTEPYRSQLFMVAIVFGAAALTLALLLRARKRHSVLSLQLGSLIMWGVLGLMIILVARPVAYLFAFPFLILAAAALARVLIKNQWVVLAIDLVVSFIFVLFIFPITALIYQGLSLSSAPIVALLVAMSVCVLLPIIDPIAKVIGQVFTLITLAVGVVLLSIGLATPFVSANHQQPNSLVYTVDANTGTSQWLSNDEEPDDWTKSVLGTDPAEVDVPESLLSYKQYGGLGPKLLSAAAKTTPALAAPTLDVVSDKTEGDVRTVKFHVNSAREAHILWYTMTTNGKFRTLSIDGVPLNVVPESKWAALGYGRPDDGYQVEVTMNAGASLNVLLTDQTVGFPDDPALGIPPRPDTTMSWWPRGKQPDSTLVTKSFTIS